MKNSYNCEQFICSENSPKENEYENSMLRSAVRKIASFTSCSNKYFSAEFNTKKNKIKIIKVEMLNVDRVICKNKKYKKIFSVLMMEMESEKIYDTIRATIVWCDRHFNEEIF